ncbi:ArsR family transcriptional regulator [Jiangella aurantiaca]|uniref:ArsR family transcriptional regulator n=1 Tax=Jiangella aurantiaca TaxID=2530373 RepID=A0A4R5A5U4_9ACTN|nr:ArsR family transcriptional regulator [Jiangella aurantiaca]TDD66356.1 ArsR family transcriptional regulator [Jiangella aurantiaca]
MRSEGPVLAPTFRSRLQGDLLALVLPWPDREWSISELAARLHAPLTTVQSEVMRLIDGGVLATRHVGRSRLLRANGDNPAVAPLTQLTLMTFGPHSVIADEFADLGADLVLLFGSWAARYHGEPGPPPADIDVLVIGDHVDRAALYEAAERAERRLQRPVNPVLRKSSTWAQRDGDPLLNEIVRRPYVEVIGEAE